MGDQERTAQYLRDQLARRTAKLPEHVQQLLSKIEPVDALDWLDKNQDGAAFTQPAASEDPVARLTPEQREMAEKTGTPLDDYARLAGV